MKRRRRKVQLHKPEEKGDGQYWCEARAGNALARGNTSLF